MRIACRHISQETVNEFTVILTDSTRTRSLITHELCDREDGRNDHSDLCLVSVRLA